MKKAIKTLAIAAVLTTLLVCSAFAAVGTNTPEWTSAEADCTLIHVVAAGTTPAHYHVEYKTNLVPGNQYALLVVKKDTSALGYTVSENTIMYIDQMATTTGVSFDFIPKSTPNCIVLLGGTFANGVKSPIKLGELTGKGVQVTGSVNYHRNIPWSVSITIKQDQTIISNLNTSSDGTFSTTLPDGNYSFVVSADGYLTHTEQVTVTTGMPNVSIDYRPYAGNTDGTAAINGTDLGNVIADYNKTTFSYKSDFDNSGAINGTDLSYLISNYNKVAD